jgi:hypothetical protein
LISAIVAPARLARVPGKKYKKRGFYIGKVTILAAILIGNTAILIGIVTIWVGFW